MMHREEVLAAVKAYEESLAVLDIVLWDVEQLRNKVLTPVIKAELEAIAFEYAEHRQAAEALIKEAKERLRLSVLAYGASIRGEITLATYSAGKSGWDAKKLEILSEMIPELNDARTPAKPRITIRKSA